MPRGQTPSKVFPRGDSNAGGAARHRATARFVTASSRGAARGCSWVGCHGALGLGAATLGARSRLTRSNSAACVAWGRHWFVVQLHRRSPLPQLPPAAAMAEGDEGAGAAPAARGGARGRKKGSKGKCSLCGMVGHNKTTCPENGGQKAAAEKRGRKGERRKENSAVFQRLRPLSAALADAGHDGADPFVCECPPHRQPRAAPAPRAGSPSPHPGVHPPRRTPFSPLEKEILNGIIDIMS